ncbi:hypothetical protein EUGRSUZ_H02251 [Eucalyptus grandis]|uniref:Uncharacterized protein n=2 Tax=Eucalyptus grandis TaxID=71139 RepID=A0ACC3JQZ0_EUCGR|nr:hypothetical protein EUGRSUZ_H02251 [Eucalyptus grandis]
METSSLYTFLPLAFLLLTLKLFSSWLKRPKNLPPSPPSIPILGHLHLIKRPFHQTLHSLSQSYGSSAEECCTKNDTVLANRPSSVAANQIGYGSTVVTMAPYGDHWRNLRRICTLEIFSSACLNSFLPIRMDEIKRLLLKLNKRTSSFCDDFTKVELKSMFLEMTFNIIVRMLTGKRDYEKKVSRLGKRSDEFLQNLIEERRGSHKIGGGGESRDTVLDHLLSLQETQPEFYTDEIIKGLILVMLIAGTDTSGLAIEWGMSYLLNHPLSLKIATEKLDSVIGQERLIDETDIAKLSYLSNITSTSTHVITGLHDRRRACPGANMAQRVVTVTLGSLIQCFEWKRISEELVDMTEGEGMNMPKVVSLEAMCKPRKIMARIAEH